MKRNVMKAAAILVLFAMVFSFAACGQKELLVRFVDGQGNDLDLAAIMGSAGNNGGAAPADSGTPAAPAASPAPAADTPAVTQAPANNDAPAATQAPANDTPAAPAADTPAETQAPAQNDTPAAPEAPAATEAPAAADDGLPHDNAGILALYTEVVNQFKVDSPEWNKVEYQEITNANLGTVANTVLNLAAGFMTTEDKARSNPDFHTKGDSMHNNTPIPRNDKGCLLTDASVIKSASCTNNGDGTATIEITLIDELNPEPAAEDAATAPSYTGAMFAPMAKADIDKELAGIPGLTVNGFTLTYTDCTTTVTFNTTDKHISDWHYIMNVDITADAKLFIATIKGSARLIDRMEYFNIKY